MAPLSLPLAWFLALATPGQLSPEKQGTSFTVSPGLEFKIWAAEPLFVNPTTFDIDPAGRIWVCEAVNYRRRLRGQPPLRSEGDRVVIVADTNGDGTLSQAEIARSINQAAGNGGKVTARVETRVSLDFLALHPGEEQSAPKPAADAPNGTVVPNHSFRSVRNRPLTGSRSDGIWKPGWSITRSVSPTPRIRRSDPLSSARASTSHRSPSGDRSLLTIHRSHPRFQRFQSKTQGVCRVCPRLSPDQDGPWVDRQFRQPFVLV